MLSKNYPQLAGMAPMIAENPSAFSGMFSAMAKPPKQNQEWQAVSGELSETGRPLEIDKVTGEIREAGPKSKATSGSAFANTRMKQYTISDLPSNQGPTTAAGAAYQVKVAARQGKSLIAKAGSPQRTALATGDLARAILRSSPTEEAMKNANFSDNTIQKWAMLKQQITADPTTVNNPQIRREIYNIFDEMDKSATPFIQNQLDDMQDLGFQITPAIRKRQLGETLPDVPFIDTTTQAPGKQQSMPMVGQKFNGQTITKVTPIQ